MVDYDSLPWPSVMFAPDDFLPADENTTYYIAFDYKLDSSVWPGAAPGSKTFTDEFPAVTVPVSVSVPGYSILPAVFPYL